MSMTGALEQTWTGNRRAAILTAARLSVDVAASAQQREQAEDLALDVSDPDATDREVRHALDRLRRLATAQ